MGKIYQTSVLISYLVIFKVWRLALLCRKSPSLLFTSTGCFVLRQLETFARCQQYRFFQFLRLYIELYKLWPTMHTGLIFLVNGRFDGSMKLSQKSINNDFSSGFHIWHNFSHMSLSGPGTWIFVAWQQLTCWICMSSKV